MFLSPHPRPARGEPETTHPQPKEPPHDRQRLVLRNQADSRRIQPRPRHRRDRPPHLPNLLLRLRGHRAGSEPIRPAGTGPHLHAPDQPDDRRRRRAHRGPRGRRRRPPRLLRPIRDRPVDPRPGGRRQQHRRLPLPVRRQRHPAEEHAGPTGHRGALRRRPARPRGLARARRRQDGRLLRRDHPQPTGRHPRHRAHRGPRPRGRRAPHRRQHGRHPLPGAPDRVGRRHRRPLGHQVPGRSRNLDRGRDRRLGQLRLRLPARALPPLQHAGRVLPRPRLRP